uniref:Uncharacterized protein n=1 Tax=Arundo donax TaxID=35708 RepID=A0A0A9E4M6_ARUDO
MQTEVLCTSCCCSCFHTLKLLLKQQPAEKRLCGTVSELTPSSSSPSHH